mmetsp:Transcript_12219/g.37267  ORF Transcript_12219/g.37267 Transcript_12219/m.37267 type:complete len:310 (-) Transcript_12219:286-1215(-)
MTEAKWDCIAFLGLGKMGSAIVERLLEVKLAKKLILWNRSREKCAKFEDKGAAVAEDVEALVSMFKEEKKDGKKCSVHMVLTGDEATTTVAQQLVQAGLSDSVVISHATTSADATAKVSNLLKENNNKFVCAPVTGRPPAAKAGQLVIWVSCDEGNADLVQELKTALFDQMSRSTKVIATDRANKAAIFKLVTNFLLYASGEMFAELAVMLEKNDLDRHAMKDWMGELAHGSIFEVYSTRIAEKDYDSEFGGGLDIAAKDLKLIKQLAKDCCTPTLEAVLAHVQGAHEAKGNLDWCALAEEVERRSGPQ